MWISNEWRLARIKKRQIQEITSLNHARFSDKKKVNTCEYVVEMHATEEVQHNYNRFI